MQETERASNGR